jgi:hypothetical protein
VNAKFKLTDEVEIKCALVSGTPTLVQIEGKHSH